MIYRFHPAFGNLIIFRENTNYEPPHYAIFSSLLLFCVKITNSSAFCFQIYIRFTALTEAKMRTLSPSGLRRPEDAIVCFSEAMVSSYKEA